MTKPVYAVADVVPEFCTFLTAEKRYPVMGVGDGYFEIIDDEGDQIICNWRRCTYLDNRGWRRIEGEEADTAVTLDELLAGLEPFATFAETFVDADGWTGPMKQERIVDWFGPSDFRLARTLIERARAGGAA